MGILNLFGKNHDDHQTAAAGRVKGPCAILLDHGIDPAGLKFTLNQDGFVTVSGRARDESERDRICQLVAEIPLVEGVRSNIVVDATGCTTEWGTETAGDQGDRARAEGQSEPAAEYGVSHTGQVAARVFKQTG